MSNSIYLYRSCTCALWKTRKYRRAQLNTLRRCPLVIQRSSLAFYLLVLNELGPFLHIHMCIPILIKQVLTEYALTKAIALFFFRDNLLAFKTQIIFKFSWLSLKGLFQSNMSESRKAFYLLFPISHFFKTKQKYSRALKKKLIVRGLAGVPAERPTTLIHFCFLFGSINLFFIPYLSLDWKLYLNASSIVFIGQNIDGVELLMLSHLRSHAVFMLTTS